jgi:hypothetical protein
LSETTTLDRFLQLVNDWARNPLHQSFGDYLIGKSERMLGNGGSIIPDFQASDEDGLFLMRCQILPTGWISGLVTSISLTGAVLSVVFYGDERTEESVPLANLKSFYIEEARKGTVYVIEGGRLVKKEINSPPLLGSSTDEDLVTNDEKVPC